ncbi:MAG TPA: nucleic acid-binding protein [Cyanobacteria bacterium UBA12227]|nr:nucleic acid-binding protein [Cyanobacteria bacterium UBA12227]HAX89133.1 nucleic acid-binding protein [Cyanobacteria bacterium UBA11370]HBY77250.1 nucleic acid-binding protein [Cyanobacteria bacterium UBA11148]
MSRIVMLDTGPLGMVTNPKTSSPICQECKLWLDNLPLKGYEVMLPEIADYEVRRELLRVGKVAGIRRLDQLKAAITYRPITTEVMLKAAKLWAEARKRGRPTSDPKALDGDVILAAQATLVVEQGNEVIVATTNVGHLAQFIDAREWRLIQ